VQTHRTLTKTMLFVATFAVAVLAFGFGVASSYQDAAAPRATRSAKARASKCANLTRRRHPAKKRDAKRHGCAKQRRHQDGGSTGAVGQGGTAGGSSSGSGPGSGSGPTAPESESPSTASAPGSGTSTESEASPSSPFTFFSPSSFWNAALASNAALDPSSTQLVSAFAREVQSEEQVKSGPWINTTHASVPVYTVPASQPMVPVKLVNATDEPLSEAWSEVPLPANAEPATGSDKDLVVWQPSSGRLWEFWRLEHGGGGWSASWGGAIRDVSSNPGVYGPEAWPGAKDGWGVSATSMSIAGGLITLEDLEAGHIDHALAIAIPNTRLGVYASPARRTDGKSTEATSIPEGAHLRLEPGLDLASLHLPKLTLMMAEAAQRYGIVVRDTAPNISFYAQDPIPTGTEPYKGAGGYFEGKEPDELLASFPWSHLQLLKMSLHPWGAGASLP
jgi:hypothetical protein